MSCSRNRQDLTVDLTSVFFDAQINFMIVQPR